MSADRVRAGGRPRSEHARAAVLHAVDDLLVEVGYAALTMKGIAERAGVGRQTVYRWWSTKAEVLFEAAITDATKELTLPARATTLEEITAYLEAIHAFLTTSHAGAAYRALIGQAQHDPAVARLLTTAALFDAPARTVVTRAVQRGDLASTLPTADAAAILTGPVFYRALASTAPSSVTTAALAAVSLAALQELGQTPAGQ